jgi:hypothetical protein
LIITSPVSKCIVPSPEEKTRGAKLVKVADP